MNWVIFIFLLVQSAWAAPLRVVLDPGHGGKDQGAKQDAISESTLTSMITKRLEQRLKNDTRFEAHITRHEDEFLSLEQRVAKAEKIKGDVFLSIHVNWSADVRAYGMEVYFQNQLPPDEESMYLAARENQEMHSWIKKTRHPAPGGSQDPELQLILQDLDRNHRIYVSSQLAKALKTAWRGMGKANSKSVRQAPFFVISNLSMPSALVEVGFLSHPKESRLLASEAYQDTVARSLHEGLVRFYESLDKTPSARLQ